MRPFKEQFDEFQVLSQDIERLVKKRSMELQALKTRVGDALKFWAGLFSSYGPPDDAPQGFGFTSPDAGNVRHELFRGDELTNVRLEEDLVTCNFVGYFRGEPDPFVLAFPTRYLDDNGKDAMQADALAYDARKLAQAQEAEAQTRADNLALYHSLHAQFGGSTS